MEIRIRPLEERDLAEADRIMRLAFGTFVGLPDPMAMFGDADLAYTRFRAAPGAALGAEMEGRLVGSNFATAWGSVGFFGPLSVEPRLWDKGVAKRLLEPTMALLDGWGCRQQGLFTFSQSAKHVALYQKFGFWPRFLTAVMEKPVAPTGSHSKLSTYAALPPEQKPGMLEACRQATDAVYGGLDVAREIRATDAQRLGDTVLILEGSQVSAFAVCHAGAKTEAGSGSCYAKFGAVRPGATAARDFERLLDACERFAAQRGAKQIEAGVNLARIEAYRALIARGFRTEIQGVAMHRHNDPGYNRPGLYILDDWR